MPNEFDIVSEHIQSYGQTFNVTTVEAFRLLGTTISQDLKWDNHIDSIVKKAQQRMHFFWQLRKFNLPQKLLTQFYSGVIESVLCASITGSATKSDIRSLQGTVWWTAERIIGAPLPTHIQTPTAAGRFHIRGQMRWSCFRRERVRQGEAVAAQRYRTDEVKRLQDRESETGRSSLELQERPKGTGASEEVQAGKQEAEPNHATPKLIAVQQLTNKTLWFKEKWYHEFPWLHYSPGVNGILCVSVLKLLGMKNQIWPRMQVVYA
ncbi:hypothetical protein QTP86_019324 [Hemibagrus guttatus]|nr:hypothetical protein QTP86_019324 [Hemibagrus guttatus]